MGRGISLIYHADGDAFARRLSFASRYDMREVTIEFYGAAAKPPSLWPHRLKHDAAARLE